MTAFFQSPFLSALGWALANSLWQMALLWLLFQLCFSTSKKITPRLTYLGALVFMMVGFVWFAITFTQQYASINSISRYLAQLPELDNATTATGAAHNSFGFGSLLTVGEKYLPYLSASYLIVLVMLFVRLANAYGYSQEIRTHGLVKIDYHWRIFVQNYAQRIGIHRAVSIFLSERIDVPATMGWLKPIILLPLATFTHLSPAQVEAVILHELSHIKRNDYLINLLISVVETILFFNPFCQLLASTIRKERENCCDDFVIQLRCDPGSYAAALLTLEKMRGSTQQQLAIAATGNQNQLLGRVKRILNVKTRKFNYGQKLVALVLTAAVLSSFAWLSPEDKVTTVKPAASQVTAATAKFDNNAANVTDLKTRILQRKMEGRRMAPLSNPRSRFNFDVANQALTPSDWLKSVQASPPVNEKNPGFFPYVIPDSFTVYSKGMTPEMHYKMAAPEINFSYSFPQPEYNRQAYGEMKERIQDEFRSNEDAGSFFNLPPNTLLTEKRFFSDSNLIKSFMQQGSLAQVDWQSALGDLHDGEIIREGQHLVISSDAWQSLKALNELKMTLQLEENKLRFENAEAEQRPTPETDDNTYRYSYRQSAEAKRNGRADMENDKKMRVADEKNARDMATRIQTLIKKQKDYAAMANKELELVRQQNELVTKKMSSMRRKDWNDRQMSNEDQLKAARDLRNEAMRDQIQRDVELYQNKLNSENQIQINHSWRDAERLGHEQLELDKAQKSLNFKMRTKQKVEGDVVIGVSGEAQEKASTVFKPAASGSGISTSADGSSALVFTIMPPKENEVNTKDATKTILIQVSGHPAPIKVVPATRVLKSKQKIRDL